MPKKWLFPWHARPNLILGNHLWQFQPPSNPQPISKSPQLCPKHTTTAFGSHDHPKMHQQARLPQTHGTECGSTSELQDHFACPNKQTNKQTKICGVFIHWKHFFFVQLSFREQNEAWGQAWAIAWCVVLHSSLGISRCWNCLRCRDQLWHSIVDATYLWVRWKDWFRMIQDLFEWLIYNSFWIVYYFHTSFVAPNKSNAFPGKPTSMGRCIITHDTCARCFRGDLAYVPPINHHNLGGLGWFFFQVSKNAHPNI